MRVLTVAALFPLLAFAAGTPENVMVVVNGDSWASTTIANEYAAMRGISPDHFVVLRDLPSFERVTVDQFRERILLPTLKAAESRGLAAHVDYVLYSADLPTAIDVSSDMAGKKFPQQITQPAAINGLTYLYQLTLSKNPTYLGLNANFYFRQVAKVAPSGPWPPEDQKKYDSALATLREIGEQLEQDARSSNSAEVPKPSTEDLRRLEEVRDRLIALRASHPTRTEIHYNLACAHARLGDGDAAVSTLREAMDKGWWDMRHAQQDADFRGVRERADFRELAKRAREAKFELWPTSGFRASVGWMPTGQPVGATRGMRYLLSTMLGYTSGRGTSVSEAIESLRRSVKADGTHPAGTVYLMENDDVRSDTRDWAFPRAVEKLRSVGVAAKIEGGVIPANKSDIMGLSVGTADFDFAKSGSTILPGAICEHLTSHGGMLGEADTQTPLTQFIRHGAAGASGTVTEPYAIQAKFPTAFVHYHYAQGCTLAEAFYQSVAGPYQLLIVGDALCAPWKKRLTVSAPELSEGMNVRGTLKVTPKLSGGAGVALSHCELYLDGRRIAAVKGTQALEFDSSKVAEGPHDLQLVAHAGDALGSNARLVVPCVVRNGTVELDAEGNVKSGGEWRWDEPLVIKVRAPGAKRVVLRSMDREVASLEGSEGTMTLDARVLGQGPVRVRPVAIFDDGREVYGRVLELRVVAPQALPAVALPEGTRVAPGFHVRAGDSESQVVTKAEGDWLAKAGVAPNGKFSVESWFRVDADEVYQFQLRGASDMRVIVDDKEQKWPRGKHWAFVPVSLAKGWHRVRIDGTAGNTPELDVRFGGPGSYRLNGERFQHLGDGL